MQCNGKKLEATAFIYFSSVSSPPAPPPPLTPSSLSAPLIFENWLIWSPRLTDYDYYMYVCVCFIVSYLFNQKERILNPHLPGGSMEYFLQTTTTATRVLSPPLSTEPAGTGTAPTPVRTKTPREHVVTPENLNKNSFCNHNDLDNKIFHLSIPHWVTGNLKPVTAL